MKLNSLIILLLFFSCNKNIKNGYQQITGPNNEIWVVPYYNGEIHGSKFIYVNNKLKFIKIYDQSTYIGLLVFENGNVVSFEDFKGNINCKRNGDQNSIIEQTP